MAFPVGSTATIGLTMTGDAAMNANLQKIDLAFAKLGLTPPPDVPAEEPSPPESGQSQSQE